MGILPVLRQRHGGGHVAEGGPVHPHPHTALIFGAAALGAAAVALAHVGATISGVDVQLGPTGPWVEANFGVLHPDPEGDWRWLCHEAVTEPGSTLTPEYVVGPDGTLLVTVTALQGIDPDHSLYRSTDGGCNWVPAGLEGQVVGALDWSGEVLLAGTADVAAGADNDIYRSEDGGSTWLASDSKLGPAVVLSVLGEGPRAWATVVDLATEEASLHRSSDRGETWATQPLPLPAGAPRLETVQVAAASGDIAWIIVGTPGLDVLLRAQGDSLQEVLATKGDLVDAAWTEAGEMWVVEIGRAVHMSEDGWAFTEVEGAPISVGVGAGSELWLTGFTDFDGAFLFDAAGPVLHPYEVVGPTQCPADSHVAELCEPLWAELEERLQAYAPTQPTGPTDGDPTDPQRRGCGR